MPAPLELVIDLFELGPHPFTDRDAPQPEPSTLGGPAEMRETKEVERLRLPQTPRLSPPSGMPPKLDQPGLVGMKFQPELREPLAKISPEPLRILLMLETNSEIVGEPDNDHVTLGVPIPPPLSPQVEYVVQVHVSQQRRNRCPLRCPFYVLRPLPVLDDACVHPLLNEPQDPLIRNAVLKKPF
jgi:hypothetical protein